MPLRQLERDGPVLRTVYEQVPRQVDYRLTAWGQALCPALDAMFTWLGQGATAIARTIAAVMDGRLLRYSDLETSARIHHISRYVLLWPR